MKKILIVALAATAAVAIESLAADDPIKQVFANLDRCLGKSDAKCVGELLVDDATFVLPTDGAKLLKGKAQIVKTLQDAMGVPGAMAAAKQTHSVENTRMIGTDHAFVDASVQITGMKTFADDPSRGPQDLRHAVGIMVLKGNTWFLQDLRSYVVAAPPPPKKDPDPTAKKDTPPPADKEASPPAKP